VFRDVLIARLAGMGDTPDYVRLVEDVLGIRGASPDMARRLVSQALVVEDRQEHWRRVGEHACRTAPSHPGTYIFRAADGQALYVGKAANLRRRLAAQFANRRWFTLNPAMARVTRVEWQVVGSEIEALLQEATLISAWQPVGNVQTGAPNLRTRAIPRALAQDVVLLLPSVDDMGARLLAARADGGVLLRDVARRGAAVAAQADEIWTFLHSLSLEPPMSSGPLAPLVFSWLAGRGRHTTRVNPRDCGNAVALRVRLAQLLNDKALFRERLVAV
jgi:hypothetical protein